MLNKQILVVDDCDLIRDSVAAYLQREGFAVRVCENGQQMRALLKERLADLVIVDLQMPEEDGFALTRFLRENYDCGIIMLTGKTDVMDRIVGLEIGADDYISKPHDPRELLARIRSVLRRAQPVQAPAATSPASETQFVFDDWRFDPGARQVMGVDGSTAELTNAEFLLLHELVRKPGRILTRDHLLGVVYERPWDYFDRSIDVLVTRLRRKLESVQPAANPIRSVRGAGYVFSRRATEPEQEALRQRA